MTPQHAAWLADSERRIKVHAQRLRDLAAAQAHEASPPILPPTDRVERLWSDRATCLDCGRNLRRHESPARPCAACEANPAPLVAEKVPAVDYGGYRP